MIIIKKTTFEFFRSSSTINFKHKCKSFHLMFAIPNKCSSYVSASNICPHKYQVAGWARGRAPRIPAHTTCMQVQELARLAHRFYSRRRSDVMNNFGTHSRAYKWASESSRERVIHLIVGSLFSSCADLQRRVAGQPIGGWPGPSMRVRPIMFCRRLVANISIVNDQLTATCF